MADPCGPCRQQPGALLRGVGRPAGRPENGERKTENGTPLRGDGWGGGRMWRVYAARLSQRTQRTKGRFRARRTENGERRTERPCAPAGRRVESLERCERLTLRGYHKGHEEAQRDTKGGAGAGRACAQGTRPARGPERAWRASHAMLLGVWKSSGVSRSPSCPICPMSPTAKFGDVPRRLEGGPKREDDGREGAISGRLARKATGVSSSGFARSSVFAEMEVEGQASFGGSGQQKRPGRGPWSLLCFLFYGGGKESRTPDLLNAIQTLYQLSYTPEKGMTIRYHIPRILASTFFTKSKKSCFWPFRRGGGGRREGGGCGAAFAGR